MGSSGVNGQKSNVRVSHYTFTRPCGLLFARRLTSSTVAVIGLFRV